jgi:hypothetical protein
MVLDRVRAEPLRRIGLGDVLAPQDFTGQAESDRRQNDGRMRAYPFGKAEGG